MSRLRPCPWLLLLALTGCDSGVAPVAPDAARLDDGQIEWQGMLACADCDGIRTQLVLSRDGGSRHYTLTETYLADDGDARFVDAGDWQRERDLLRLRNAAGDIHVYAVLPDGRLQPRDARGRPFRPREDDFLAPVTAAHAP